MDENRLKKIVQSALDVSFKGVMIKEFRALETSQMNDEGTWQPYSHTLFITLSVDTKINENYLQLHEIITFLENLLGFECCVDFS